MKNTRAWLPLCAAIASILISTASLQAQTYVAVTNLLFAEDFSTYPVESMPTTASEGGLWSLITWAGANGSAAVVTNEQDLFGQGLENRFFRASSTRDLFMTTPTFFSQDVVIFEFDFIGHFPPGDGSRWFNVELRSGTAAAQVTGLRIYDTKLRTAATDVPRDPSYGENDKTIRVWTVMNNKPEDILYDAPDGSGTTLLAQTNASVWLYHYETSTWEHLMPQYNFARTASTPTGYSMDSLRFYLDNNASLRSFDMDNIKVYGGRGLLPTTHVAITNLLFQDDFESYAIDGMPSTTANGGKWGTAIWNGTAGTAGVAEDINNIFGLGIANRYLQLSNTHNVTLITAPFSEQEVLTFAFDFVGHFYDGIDGSRWINISPRNATGDAHITSLTMSSTTVRGTTVSYGPNDSLVRIVTVVNNRQGNITYNRLEDAGTATLGAGKASLWIRTPSFGWEQIVPEYIYTRTTGFPFGAVMDRLRFFMDSNAVYRSLDLDNIEVHGSIKPIAPPVNLSAEVVAGNVRVRWIGTTGHTYQVQYRAEVNSGDWINVGDPIIATTDDEQMFEENMTDTIRFYRVLATQ